MRSPAYCSAATKAWVVGHNQLDSKRFLYILYSNQRREPIIVPHLHKVDRRS